MVESESALDPTMQFPMFEFGNYIGVMFVCLLCLCVGVWLEGIVERETCGEIKYIELCFVVWSVRFLLCALTKVRLEEH